MKLISVSINPVCDQNISRLLTYLIQILIRIYQIFTDMLRKHLPSKLINIAIIIAKAKQRKNKEMNSSRDSLSFHSANYPDLPGYPLFYCHKNRPDDQFLIQLTLCKLSKIQLISITRGMIQLLLSKFPCTLDSAW